MERIGNTFDPYATIANTLLNQGVPEEELSPDAVEPAVTEEVDPPGGETPPSNQLEGFEDVFLNEEWLPKNVEPKDLPEWYQTKYKELVKKVGGKDFEQMVIESLREQLISEVEGIEDFKSHYLNFKANPGLYAIQQFPEALAKIGVEPVLNETQIFAAVEKEMIKNFGANYENLIDPSQALKLGTHSYQIVEKQREIYNSLLAKNEENKLKFQAFQQQATASQNTPESLDETTIVETAKKEFANFSKKIGTEEEFVNFVTQSVKTKWIPSFEDIWKLKNIDKVMEEEYQRGLREGKSKHSSEIRKQYGVEPKSATAGAAQKIETKDTHDEMTNYYNRISRVTYDPYEAIRKQIIGE